MTLDTTFDFRSDANGKDPDLYSPTLRRYHQRLWSKRLPTGIRLQLVDTTPGLYLHHADLTGGLHLSSDSIIPSFSTWSSMRHIIGALPLEDTAAFKSLGYTIGGMMVFPGSKVDGRPTINGARGFHPRIADRMDLTLECIRRHYAGEASPLTETLARYASFFQLLGSFKGYVEFFLLQDLVTADFAAVAFFMPFGNFATPALPKDTEAYIKYRALSIAFIHARNDRIAAWAAENY